MSRVLVVSPPQSPGPPIPLGEGNVLLLASPVGIARHIVFKIKDFDPNKHPRGYKGLFIDTPDKIEARHAEVGDIVVGKSGKAFRVNGHGPKGIKVSSVDQTTGEVLSKGTVIAHGITVARVEGGKGPGTQHAIKDLPAGTIVQHPKSGKRFEIGKQGKWTTVYQVDAQGNRQGKHSVLQPETSVIVATKARQATSPSPAQAAQANAAVKKVQASPTPTAPNAAPVTPVQETLPKVFPKMPKLYSAGVSKDTEIHITESIEGGTYKIERVSKTSMGAPMYQTLGSETSLAKAKAVARADGSDHEAILVSKRPDPHKLSFEVGEWALYGANLVRVTGVRNWTNWRGHGEQSVNVDGYAYAIPSTSLQRIHPDDFERWRQQQLDRHGMLWAPRSGVGVRHHESADLEFLRESLLSRRPLETARTARPNKYTEVLQPDWDLGNLAGKSRTEAAKILKTLGYGEIEPREPDKLKVINSHRKRLDVHIKGGKVSSVDERESEVTQGASKRFYDQLKEVLDSGGDVRLLDPTHSPFAEERGSHVRQLIYDMALGKQNGVAEAIGKSTARVKTDEAYAKEIDKDGLFPRADFEKQVTFPDVGLFARGTVIEEYWPSTKLDHFDFPSRQFRIDYDAATHDEAYTAAIQAAVSRKGIAELAVTGPGRLADYKDDLFGFAEELQHAHDKLAAGAPSELDSADQATKDYVQMVLGSKPVSGDIGQTAVASASRAVESSFNEHSRRVDALQTNAMADEIRKRRAKEGTVASAKPVAQSGFDLPVWEELNWEAQDLAGLETLIRSIPKTTRSHVPVFFSGGLLRDGVAYVDKEHTIHARVPQDFDEQMKQRVGGDLVENSKNINPGYASSSGSIHPGVMLLVEDSVQPPSKLDPAVVNKIADGIQQNLVYEDRDFLGDAVKGFRNAEMDTFDIKSVEAAWLGALEDAAPRHPNRKLSTTMAADRAATLLSNLQKDGLVSSSWTAARAKLEAEVDRKATSLGGARGAEFRVFAKAALDSMPASASAVSGHVFKRDVLGPRFGAVAGRAITQSQYQYDRDFQEAVGGFVGEASKLFDAAHNRQKPARRRIEYVPHSAPGQDTPTNQRGRLTIEGYTPAEAIAKLKDLGIVHDLEPEVPFQQVMRSKRRYGFVNPLLSDYVQGEAPLPQIPAAISHGITGGMFGSAGAVERLEQVLESGGLMSTAERFRQGISVATTTPAGDIRSGVDHVLFGCMGLSQYGQIKIIYKDSAYLRRDMLVTDRDFGPQQTRYPSYRKYLNKHRKLAGEPDSDTNIYVPLSPGARQSHINQIMTPSRWTNPRSLNAGNNEWNVANSVAIEDMAYLVVPSAADQTRVKALLQKMLADGRISEAPAVVSVAPTDALDKTGGNWKPGKVK